jgi:hypothetical protein
MNWTGIAFCSVASRQLFNRKRAWPSSAWCSTSPRSRLSTAWPQSGHMKKVLALVAHFHRLTRRRIDPVTYDACRLIRGARHNSSGGNNIVRRSGQLLRQLRRPDSFRCYAETASLRDKALNAVSSRT